MPEPRSPQQIAADLVADGRAQRILALDETPCVTTIALAGWNGNPNLYVLSSGEVRLGYTLRTSKRVSGEPGDTP